MVSLRRGSSSAVRQGTPPPFSRRKHDLSERKRSQKHFPNGSFTIGSTTYTTASLVQVLQGLANTMTALNAAQAGAKDALAAEQGAETMVGPIVRAYRRPVRAAFANATQTLADFGVAPPKVRTPLTTEQKAAAAAKAKRLARGTTSKKQ